MSQAGGMDWSYLRPKLVVDTLAAVAVAVFVSLISNVHIAASVVVLLVSWPVADVAIEKIASRDPGYTSMVTKKRWWPPFVTMAVWFVVGGIVHFVVSVPFLLALGYSILGLSLGGAIFGISVELEDSRENRNETHAHPPTR